MRGIIIGSLLGLVAAGLTILYHWWLEGASPVAYVVGAVCMAIVTTIAIALAVAAIVPCKGHSYKGPDYD